MAALLSTTASGVAVNYISNELLLNLSRIKDKQELHLFEEALKKWAIDFEQAHDGTIATSGEFAGYVKNQRTVETVVSYVLSPDANGPDEQAFLNQTQASIVQRLEERRSHRLSPIDAGIILEFLKSLLAQAKRFASSGLNNEEKIILYSLCQHLAWDGKIEKLIQNRFNVTEQALDKILAIVSAAQNPPEAETQLPPEFDHLILSCNDILRKSHEKLKVYSFSDGLDFRSVYIPPSLDIRIDCENPSRFLLEAAGLERTRLWKDQLIFPLQENAHRDFSRETDILMNYSFDADVGIANTGQQKNTMEERQRKIDTLFDRSNIVYVIGGAGYGKSLFLKNLCVNPQGLTGYREKPFLIIRGDLKRMIQPTGMFKPMRQYLEECFVHACLQKPDDLTPNFLERCLAAGRCLILLDALDEVGNDQREELHQRVISYFQLVGAGNKVCITSRDRGFIPVKQITCFTIRRISIQNVGEYVDRFIQLEKFPSDERERFIEQASSIVKKGFVTGFLTLSLLLAIYKNEQELPANKAELYKLCFEYIANRREKDKRLLRNSDTGEEYDWNTLGKLMNEATFMKLAQMGTPNNRDILQKQIYEMMTSLYEKRFSNQTECRVATELFLQFCADRTEVFVPSPSSNTEYRFFHRSFYEYFYANYLMQYNAGPEGIYQELIHFQVDSELFELLVALYYQKNPEQLRALLQYSFERAENISQGRVNAGKAFDILAMLMRTADESDFTQHFIQLVVEHGDRISKLPLSVNFEQIQEILSKNQDYLETAYQENRKLYDQRVVRETATFLLKNPRNYNQLLQCNNFNSSAWTIPQSSFKYTYLLKLLPDQYSHMIRIFNKLRSIGYLRKTLKLTSKDIGDLSTFADKVRKSSVENQKRTYRLLLSILTYPL